MRGEADHSQMKAQYRARSGGGNGKGQGVVMGQFCSGWSVKVSEMTVGQNKGRAKPRGFLAEECPVERPEMRKSSASPGDSKEARGEGVEAGFVEVGRVKGSKMAGLRHLALWAVVRGGHALRPPWWEGLMIGVVALL